VDSLLDLLDNFRPFGRPGLAVMFTIDKMQDLKP